MRPANSSANAYAAGDPPVDPTQLQRFLREELAKIAAAIAALAAGHLDKTYVAPAKPRDGDVRYADGTSWAPGVKGLYMYNGTTWILVKAL
jgi:hypothetical protein